MDYATTLIFDANEPLEIALASEALFEQYSDDDTPISAVFGASPANDDAYDNLYPNLA